MIETGTATDHDDLFDKLRTFLGTGGSTGPGWTELDYNGTDRTVLFEAPGLSTTEEIHFGFGVEASVGTDSFALTGWMFKAYNDALGHKSQPGISGVGYHAVWDDSIPYWFIANGQRVIIITKVSTVYTASYLGKFLPYGVPGDYPQPYYVGMPASGNSRWSTTSETFRNFFDPGDHVGSEMLNPNGTWYRVGNYVESSGESVVTDGNYLWPYSVAFGSNLARTRWREMRNNVDDTVPLWPIVLVGEDPSGDTYGMLDGAFAVSGFSLSSEDLVTSDAVDHLVVQNVFRTARYYYAAMKLE
jgi:hypothetical protein